MLVKLKNRLKDQRGLTLVELLAVIVILGIIAAIAVPSIMGIITKSKDDALRADAIQILNSAKLYTSSNNVANGSKIYWKEDTEGEHTGLITLVDFTSKVEGLPNEDDLYVTVAENSNANSIHGIIEAGGRTLILKGATLKHINDGPNDDPDDEHVLIDDTAPDPGD